MFPIINILGKSYYSYHLFFILSVIGTGCMFFLFEKNRTSIIDKIYLFSICFISGIMGSKLFFFFEDIHMTFSQLVDLKNGFVFYGGFVGVVIALLIYFYRNIKSFYDSLDRLAISSAFGMFIGKIGCLLAGCCYGYPTGSVFGVYFNSINSAAYNPTMPLFPIQVVDSLLNLLLFSLLLNFRKRLKLINGYLFLIYILLYSIFRFVTEFYRADISRGFVFDWISLSQFYSIILIVLVIGYYSIKSFFYNRKLLNK